MSNINRGDSGYVDDSIEPSVEDFELSYSYGESRPRADAMLGGNQAPTDEEAVANIRDTVLRFENLPADALLDAHGVLTTSPYLSVSGGQTKTIDRQALADWQASQPFQDALVKYDGNNNNIAVVRLATTMIDDHTASAQYTIEDTLPGGIKKYARSAAMLIKEGTDWKISVHSQHPVDL